MVRNAHSAGAIIVLALTGFACGDTLLSGAPIDGPMRDAGTAASVDRNLVEDFDNQMLIESVTGAALLDVNQGIVTLPVEAFPTIDGAGLDMVQRRVEQNGLVEAETILVAASGSLEASDSIELRAHDLVRVSGSVRAGPGGVTIVAGREVIIDGVIESRGPVRILVEDPAGVVRIAGRVTVHASADDPEGQPPHLMIMGRSAVEISGQLISTAGPRRLGGDIAVRVYEPIKVLGYDARVATSADPSGTPGMVRLRSESTITVGNGALVGFVAPTTGSGAAMGGDIEIQGTTVRIQDGAGVEAGGRPVKGGSVFITAAEALAVDTLGWVRSGAGAEGGNLQLKATRIGVGEGAVIEAGQGRSYGAHFRIEAVESIDLVDGARVLGGNTACGPGGAVQIAVGGLVRARAEAEIHGGDGGVEFGNGTCTRTAAGGDVQIEAREALGVDGSAFAGRGFPDGEVRITIDETFTVARPNLTVGTFGQVISRILDRGVEARGQIPQLLSWAGDLPGGTNVEIELSGSSLLAGPYESWVSMSAPVDGDEGPHTLADAQFFRYRVSLVGRAFDAPTLDYFELDFSPED